MSKVQAQTKSVKQLLSKVRYDIDFYQRGYVWERRHVEELLDDFERRFLDNYHEAHERGEVRLYPHYFLGNIITITENNQKYIVDGQQRLTTLTCLLIYIHHMAQDGSGVADVKDLIFSESYGTKTFNLDIPERLDCMRALYEGESVAGLNSADLSVRNLLDRYKDLEELFPESLRDGALPYFVDWLIENVDLVEIEAQSDDDAFTIFETMNDRGVNLSQADMLKGYLLAHINFADPNMMQAKKEEANRSWKQRMTGFAELENGSADDFFKTWLRAKYAGETRKRKKGAVNQDFEDIDKYHRWARDNRARLGLNEKDSQAFYDFVTERIRRFAGHYIRMKRAAQCLTQGQEEIYYNSYNNFTLQYMLALAPLRDDDDVATVNEKIRVVTIFADIFLARRMVNSRRNGYSTLQYTMFNLTKKIRDKDLDDLRDILLGYLDSMWETFEGITGHKWSGIYSLNKFSGRSIRYLLVRTTAWIDQQSGINTDFDTYARPKNESFDIEHIWSANSYPEHQDDFASEDDFHRERNQFGGLLLLPRSVNRSLSDKPYERKVKKYVQQNLLAASLNEAKYLNEPSFSRFREISGLQFKPHTQFTKADLLERQQLYRQICEQIWNPDRLNAI